MNLTFASFKKYLDKSETKCNLFENNGKGSFENCYNCTHGCSHIGHDYVEGGYSCDAGCNPEDIGVTLWKG